MKKKIIVIITCIILISIPIILLIIKNSSKKLESQPIKNSEILDNNIIEENKESYIKEEKENNIIRDKESNEILFDPSIQYPKKEPNKTDFAKETNLEEEIEFRNLYEYLKYFLWAFPEQTKTDFSEKDIAIIVSLASQIYEPRSTSYIQKIAKQYFNLDNYELPIGTYDLQNFGKYTIIKENNYYIRSNIQNFFINNQYSLFLTNLKNEENKIILSYDYAEGGQLDGGCYQEWLSEEEKNECKIGEYIFELTYIPNDDVLMINKIQYIKKGD